jgi:hypothetical protein
MARTKNTDGKQPVKITVEKQRPGKRVPVARLVIPMTGIDKLGEIIRDLAQKADKQLPQRPTMARGSISLFI